MKMLLLLYKLIFAKKFILKFPFTGSLGTYKSKSLSDISFDFWQNSHQQDFIEQNNESLENEKNIYTSPVEEVEDKFSLATDLIF